MDGNDGTSGFYGDLPYFGPVECSAFYDVVASCKLHRISEQSMTRCRSFQYFAKDTSKVAQALFHSAFNGKEGSVKSKALNLPELRSTFSPCTRLFLNGEGSYITIEDTSSRDVSINESDSVACSVKLDFYGIRAIWSQLVEAAIGCSHDQPPRFLIANIDCYLSGHCASGAYLLSTLLIGIASILHYYSTKEDCASRLNDFSLTFTVLGSSEGALLADRIRSYIESALRISVKRILLGNDIMSTYLSLLSNPSNLLMASTHSEWVEILRSTVVDIHEQLCEESNFHHPGVCTAPVILVVVPLVDRDRTLLSRELLDSYTSEPIRLVFDDDCKTESFSGTSPVIFVCSTSWICSQFTLPKFEQLTSHLHLKNVVHGGWCEYGSDHVEEIVHTLTTLKAMCRDVGEMTIVQHGPNMELSPLLQTPMYFAESRSLMCVNVILLLFRRFLMKYSPITFQPLFSVSKELLFSDHAWKYYTKIIEELRLCGIAEIGKSDLGLPVVELTALGRYLSFRFRFSDGKSSYPELSPIDSKILLWSHLFKQSFTMAQELIAERYNFSEWVKGRMELFCLEHNIAFEKSVAFERKALICRLSCFSRPSSVKENRAHYILGAPFGSRKPVQNHLMHQAPTVCRGWYEHAPLRTGASVNEKQVSVFCLPKMSLYCEIEGPEKMPLYTIQCPTEISYPLIIAHSVLHISAHNNCVFLEMPNSIGAVPLPTQILQSQTMCALLDGSDTSNVGLWLDGTLGDRHLEPSNFSMLAPLSLKGHALIGLCERSAFQRKRARLSETPDKSHAEQDSFSGMKPRTEAELDAVSEFVKLIAVLGKEKAENSFKSKKGFGFIDQSHELHPYYLHMLKVIK